jgi:UDP-3-O-[3-hydroxymyristoyl] N-acetylglucosamine deacetylase/3-hydroxyacyl-[acyl-carrier-protein] dehydratase
MPRKQRSVLKEGELSGIGLHSGAKVRMRVKPAPPDAGVVFVRTDLPSAPRIPADAHHLTHRQRRTALVGEGGAEVHTIEHLLACLVGLHVDNLVVELDGTECPGMDGSAADFVRLLEGLRPVEQDALRAEIVVDQPLAVALGEASALTALPAREGLTVSYTLDYRNAFPGTQHFSFRVDPVGFKEEVAGARTFCLQSEADALRKQNLGLGATYENTLVIGPKGVVENTLRWPDEFARHKTLDLLGDLFLVGADLRGHVLAYRTGHDANMQLVRALRERAAVAPAAKGPDRLPRAVPGMGQAQIRRILPHRYPFLLVDRVLEIDGYRRAVGVKNVTVNEPFFQGHYPGEPIMPGVMIVEAMAQLAGILLLRKLELSGKVPVLLSIDRVKFRRAVVPGDQIRLEAETLRLSGDRGRVQCRSTVGDALVAEARLNFALTESSPS